ncbi:MAG: 8-amino-7-oxononanoate synthase [Muribaculaceae bacterium]|nr:8-amino-7-oxononanoate synthase [Muribaculaceae bacterium]
MKQIIERELAALKADGRFRKIADQDTAADLIDLSSNDYLGLAARADLHDAFLDSEAARLPLSASASRLLAAKQSAFGSLERTLEDAYGRGRRALLFNSGYHANTGTIAALCGPNTIIIADKLVHASIIDGMKLSGARFERFRHNDTAHLRRLLEKAVREGLQPLIIVESVYSMDGDYAPLEEIAQLKSKLAPDGLLYVDEAHAVGVEGDAGLGLANTVNGVDVIIGTFGKALASVGAYAIVEPYMRDWLVNRSRSLIFSTALPPMQVAWTEFMFKTARAMDSERKHLRELSTRLGEILYRNGATDDAPGHIRPLITGDPVRAVKLSEALLREGFNVLPIRRPTVPPGTDRLRFSLSAALDIEQLKRLDGALSKVL